MNILNYAYKNSRKNNYNLIKMQSLEIIKKLKNNNFKVHYSYNPFSENIITFNILLESYDGILLYTYLYRHLKHSCDVILNSSGINIVFPESNNNLTSLINFYNNFNNSISLYINSKTLTNITRKEELNIDKSEVIKDIDESLKSFILTLWERNIETIFSCSGMACDHINKDSIISGYVLIKINDEIDFNLYKILLKNLNLTNVFITTSNNGKVPVIYIKNFKDTDANMYLYWKRCEEILNNF